MLVPIGAPEPTRRPFGSLTWPLVFGELAVSVAIFFLMRRWGALGLFFGPAIAMTVFAVRADWHGLAAVLTLSSDEADQGREAAWMVFVGVALTAGGLLSSVGA